MPGGVGLVHSAGERRTFGRSPDRVGALDAWVEQVAAHWGKTQGTAFRTRLCIAELAANVVEHGIARSSDDKMVVALYQYHDGIGIEFLDSCAPFDPTQDTVKTKVESIESMDPGGRGLMLLRAYAENLAYRNDGTCNCVTMKIKSA